MKTGTKSVLFGVHNFVLHPLTVYVAWVQLYHKLPNLKETICIFVHDWGYWGKSNMNGQEGELHPELGAKIANKLFGEKYRDLCLCHSRHYAHKIGKEPSPLCWADKASILLEPWWLYLPRAWASSELTEYRIQAALSEFIPIEASHRQWYAKIQKRYGDQGKAMKSNTVVC